MKRGFTLVELSIVLVIIGLLIGGILAAQSMIGTAKIQAQIRQYQQFDIAITNFKTKFNQIPGDCNICGNGAGNNNGLLESNGSPLVVPIHELCCEAQSFFSDLYKMQMIKTVFTQSSNFSFEIGEGKQFPPAAIGRSGIWVAGNGFGDLYYAFMSKDALHGGAYYVNGFMLDGSLSPTEALAIDTKVDDGKPNTGEVVAVWPGESTSADQIPFILQYPDPTYCVNNAAYNLSLTATNLCRLAVKSQFH